MCKKIVGIVMVLFGIEVKARVMTRRGCSTLPRGSSQCLKIDGGSPARYAACVDTQNTLKSVILLFEWVGLGGRSGCGLGDNQKKAAENFCKKEYGGILFSPPAGFVGDAFSMTRSRLRYFFPNADYFLTLPVSKPDEDTKERVAVDYADRIVYPGAKDLVGDTKGDKDYYWDMPVVGDYSKP